MSNNTNYIKKSKETEEFDDKSVYVATNKVLTFKDVNSITSQHEGPNLPVESLNHCLLSIGMDSAFMFGGWRKVCPSYFPENDACIKEQILLDNTSRQGYLYENGSWSAIEELSPCRHANYAQNKAMCAKRSFDIIIPGYDEELKKPCTAIFNLKNKTWRKLEDESGRKSLKAGIAISIANDTRVLYVGGRDKYGLKLNTVYELIGTDYWKEIPEMALMFTVDANDAYGFFPIHTEYCNSQIKE